MAKGKVVFYYVESAYNTYYSNFKEARKDAVTYCKEMECSVDIYKLTLRAGLTRLQLALDVINSDYTLDKIHTVHPR